MASRSTRARTGAKRWLNWREGADSGRLHCNAYASRGLSSRGVRTIGCVMSAFVLSHTLGGGWSDVGALSHTSVGLLRERGATAEFSVEAMAHSTRSRGRLPESERRKPTSRPTVLVESSSSSIHCICRPSLPRSTPLSTTYRAGFWHARCFTIFMDLSFLGSLSSIVLLQVGQLCRCVRVSKLCNLLRRESRRCNSCAVVFSCDAAWSIQSSMPHLSVRARVCEAAPSDTQ